MDKPLNITFILPVLDETSALKKTVDIIFEIAAQDIHEILIVIADITVKESHVVIEEIRKQHPSYIRVHKQELPFLGGAMREAFDIASGDYVMLMASDMETDPTLVPKFIETMKEGCWDIVAGSRWIEGGGFEGYSKLKLILNYLFQQIFRVLYTTKLTDLTFAYRLYRKTVLKGIIWQELRHPFLLESLLKPLRCGARATEIPCRWQVRVEGSSANTFLATFKYLKTAIKIRFIPIHGLKKKESMS